MFHVLKNVKGKLDVNWEGVAIAMNLKNVNVAKVRFGQIKKKLNWDSVDQGETAAGPGPQSPQVTPVKKSRGRKPQNPETPTKKRKSDSGPVNVFLDSERPSYLDANDNPKKEEDDSSFHPDIYSDVEN